MNKPVVTSHPLKNRPATSQNGRIVQALDTSHAPVDGSSMADRLNLISAYARQINFYEYHRDGAGGEYQDISNWHAFFRESLPFQLAVLSKTSSTRLEREFMALHAEVMARPAKQSLESLLGFIFNRLIEPTSRLYVTVEHAQNSMSVPLLAIITSAFMDPLKRFIALYNASSSFLCIGRRSFTTFSEAPWQLKADDIYALDACLQQIKKGEKAGIVKAGDTAASLFYLFLSGFRRVVETAPDFINESLVPLEASLQKKHQPHLALIFTFLELFKHLQGNINQLGIKHLDFFYKRVLRLTPRPAEPDKAHVIFELANHLDTYLLRKDLRLKDGKDNANQDILFGLDNELVIDKAQVKEVRTLFVNTRREGENKLVEGVYMAPVANLANGTDKPFDKEGVNSWPTLGGKYSKFVGKGSEVAVEYPFARLGFVLASPVLLLEEGKRKITVVIDCSILDTDHQLQPPDIDQILADIESKLSVPVTKTTYYLSDQLLDTCNLSPGARGFIAGLLTRMNPYPVAEELLPDLMASTDFISCKPVFNTDDKKNLMNCLKGLAQSKVVTKKSLFKLAFSGEKSWIEAIPKVQIQRPPLKVLNPQGQIQFELTVELEDGDPAIVFYDADLLGEKFDLKTNFPLVKIELDPSILVDEGQEGEERQKCCLSAKAERGRKILSPYHYLRWLRLINAEIQVEVCGLKNFIVQNDENLQDVNRPIMPFGPRPRVADSGQVDGGANFYIGSKEIFFKNWEKFWINVEWKDKPTNLQTHYKFYASGVPFEDGSANITNSSFKYRVSVLEDGVWKNHFKDNSPNPPTYLYELFSNNEANDNTCSTPKTAQSYSYGVKSTFTPGLNYKQKTMPFGALEPLNVNSRKGFARITLAGVGFQHDRYTFVLAKQLMALSKLIGPEDMKELILKSNQALLLSNESGTRITNILNWGGSLNALKNEVSKFPPPPPPSPIFPQDISPSSLPPNLGPYGLRKIDNAIRDRILKMTQLLNPGADGIPNEPYTPLIKSISLDYRAVAKLNDMDIVHIYPFARTSKFEEIESQPSLLPFFDNEGSLFIGIEKCTPGGSLSLLFQMAEATADSESNPAKISWEFLGGNRWHKLLPDFEILSDGTDGFTTSGIVKIAVPQAITNQGNTIMPNGLYWLKASTAENVAAVAETINIHTQAARATAVLAPLNDTARLETALEAKSISKLADGDFSIKKVEQPYSAFAGRKPEQQGHFYVRVSELLKHRGRGITIQDYEKVILEEFPQVYKVKCISHTLALSARTHRRDLEIAPGYVLVAVIPDLTKLQAGNHLQPKVPVSLLARIGDQLKQKIGPFARLKVMNPRYENIDVNITVRLYRGKSESFFANRLKQDLTNFLAPWHLGDSEKLNFGQEVLFSDVVGFVERLDYVDYIVNLGLRGPCDQNNNSVIKPLTARSILTGGRICVLIDREVCDKPNR